MFSTPIEKCLRSCGWNPFRRVPTHKIEFLLEKEGYLVSSAALDFLTSFGGLKIAFQKQPTLDTMDFLDFDTEKAVREVAHDWIIEDYSKRIGNPLCLIGQGFTNHMNFSMSSEGKVYGGFDDLLYFIANSGQEAIEILFKKHKLEEIK